MSNEKTPFYKNKMFLIGFFSLMVLGLISQFFDTKEKEKIADEENKRYEEYINSDRYKDSIANWEAYKNSDRYKDSLLIIDKTKNFLNYISITDLEWRAGGFGSVAILNKITFKNESLKDVKNIIVNFQFKAETGEVLKNLDKEFKIIVNQNEIRTINDVNLGFINNQSKSVSYSIKSAERN